MENISDEKGKYLIIKTLLREKSWKISLEVNLI